MTISNNINPINKLNIVNSSNNKLNNSNVNDRSNDQNHVNYQNGNLKLQNNQIQQRFNLNLSPSSPSSIPNPSNLKKIKQNLPEIDQKTLNQIDRIEFQRQWGPHLVPLQFVIQRTIAQVFSSLQLAAQISPTLEEYDRKKRVVDFIVHSRRQLIKLLVLVKWSSNSISVHKIMSIVAFLQRQNSQFDRTVNILRASKENFHTARMRNYDVPTALQVLTNRYPTLPGQLIEQFDSKPNLSDEQVLEIMHELNQLIRYRLASDEVIPKAFRSYRIYDGRVFFKVDKMFECSLTVGGGQLDSRWFLLHVEFLFKVTGPRGKDFLSIPHGPVKNQIIECGNRIMAPTLSIDPNQDPKSPERPIMKVFAYLRDLCLNYQLEALHYQASQLGRSAWAKHTRLLIPPDRSTLTVLYWTHARPIKAPLTRPGQAPKSLSHPTPLGSITIRRYVERHSQSRTNVLNFLNGYPSISSSSKTPSHDDGDFGASHVERLQTIWRPTGFTSSAQAGGRSALQELENLQISEGKEVVFLKQSEDQSIELELLMNELSLEDVLQRVVRVHIDCILRKAFSDLTGLEQPTASGSAPSSIRPLAHFKSVRLIPWEKNSTTNSRCGRSMEIILHARHAVELSVDEFSGRFRLQSVIVPDYDHVQSDEAVNCEPINRQLRTDCLSAFNSADLLSSSANSLNFNPSGLRDVLDRLKSDILLDKIELKARILGIRTTRSLPIQIQQLLTSNPPSSYAPQNTTPSQLSSQSIMYCKLNNFPYHYLIIQVTGIGIRCALILVDNTSTFTNTSPNLFWRVHQILHLQVPSFVGDSDDDGGALDQFTLSRAQLQYVYHHCLIQVTLSRLMHGLKKDGIAYEQLLPLTPRIIKEQNSILHHGKHGHPSSNITSRSLQLHSSFEVVGLLSVPLLAFLKPTLVTQKQFFSGQYLAVKVFVQPKSYFGVQVEVRLKFNSDKIKAEELERIIRSKQTNLNAQILSTHMSNLLNSKSSPTMKPAEVSTVKALKNEKVEEEDDDDDEEPLSKRIQNVKFLPTTSNLGLFPQQPVDLEEEEEEIQNSENDDMVLDFQLVDDADWAVDSNQNELIFTPSFFHFFNSNHHTSSVNPFLSIYQSSIRKFFSLIHASSD